MSPRLNAVPVISDIKSITDALTPLWARLGIVEVSLLVVGSFI